MSENSSEYLKRTCLICGCHTNQTINIYEPRSGPNIVQLIQAKFKFQPLNEDKYLCFSCNNWLINWHSLQALNSNDAESPSGTFRSHLSSGHVMQEEKSSGSKKQAAVVCRPIAKVKPRQLAERAVPQAIEHSNDETTSALNVTYKTANKINFNKRNFRLQLAKRGMAKVQLRAMQQCSCGKYLVVRSSNKAFNKNAAVATPLKCRKCRRFSRFVEQQVLQGQTPLLVEPHKNSQNLVIETVTNTTNESQSLSQQQQQPQEQPQLPLTLPPATAPAPAPAPVPAPQIRHNYLPKPTIDGKVVSMLRRLGTTLSREPQENGRENTTTNLLPQIMSPTKTKPKWLRPLEDDEILINFNANISEVLPSLADQFTHVNTLAARKRLTFQVLETAEVIDLCEESATFNKEQENFDSTFNLPRGLAIYLV